MSYNKFQKKEAKFDLTAFSILLQNLTNRATEIAIHNAKQTDSKVTVEDVTEIFAELKAFAGGQIKEFMDKNS